MWGTNFQAARYRFAAPKYHPSLLDMAHDAVREANPFPVDRFGLLRQSFFRKVDEMTPSLQWTKNSSIHWKTLELFDTLILSRKRSQESVQGLIHLLLTISMFMSEAFSLCWLQVSQAALDFPAHAILPAWNGCSFSPRFAKPAASKCAPRATTP